MTKASSTLDRAKSYYKSNPWKSRALITGVIFILLFSFMRIILAPAIIYGTTSWLADQDIDSSIEDIHFNIIDGTVSLINAKGHEQGNPLFNIGLIEIYWRWTPLSKKTMVVKKVALHQFQINIEQYTNEIVIGGVKISLADSSAKAPPESAAEKNNESRKDKDVKPWAASLGEVIFTELNICYLQHSSAHSLATKENLFVDYCVDLENMTWGGTISYATDKALLETDDIAISSTGNFSLGGLTVTDNRLNKKLLTSSSNTLEEVNISGLNNIHINKLIMNELSALKRDDDKHKDTIRFDQLLVEDTMLTNMNSLSINQVTIDSPGFYLVKLAQSTWEHQQWIPASDIQSTNSSSNSNNTLSSDEFKLSLHNITINNSDICHNNEITDFYYCFTSEAIKWTGTINYDTQSSAADTVNLKVTGDFALTQPEVRNVTIDRTLLDFEALKISNLNVAGLSNITSDNVSIENLHALQRGEKPQDNTLAFNKLHIQNLSYQQDAVSIDDIKLTGLSNTVSKNKTGTWEHDKWQPEASDAAPAPAPAPATATATAPAPAPADSGENKKADKPFKISLNNVSIETDSEIQYIDNSTEPAMEVGLQKLSFEIKSLYSAKPKANSPFKLYAKTNRHSTIDVAGTVKPFDEKISFTADGDLKGFDLRAATPATQKSIGHIIKSGQLDAKLKLLAADGILDSKVSLSLYQFHIKPMNKKAAAELDSQFGMPLNQTLVLLRDKDDSIHMDIPITGDINNPDFDPMGAIVKATSKAATVTLITFFTPYGLIYAGGNVAFNLATALNFDPLDFEPGKPDLNDVNKEQLDSLTGLLTEKPQVHLTLCGSTNQADLFTLFPELNKVPQANNDKDDTASEKNIALTKEHKAALKKLAIERQINSKNYLINISKISHDRLILCEPEPATEEDSLSGVEINI